MFAWWMMALELTCIAIVICTHDYFRSNVSPPSYLFHFHHIFKITSSIFASSSVRESLRLVFKLSREYEVGILSTYSESKKWSGTQNFLTICHRFDCSSMKIDSLFFLFVSGVFLVVNFELICQQAGKWIGSYVRRNFLCKYTYTMCTHT